MFIPILLPAQPVAIKEFEWDISRSKGPSAAVIESFKNEIEMLRKAQHPHVVKLYGAQTSPRCVNIKKRREEH